MRSLQPQTEAIKKENLNNFLNTIRTSNKKDVFSISTNIVNTLNILS
jgi:hypothetical protein